MRYLFQPMIVGILVFAAVGCGNAAKPVDPKAQGPIDTRIQPVGRPVGETEAQPKVTNTKVGTNSAPN